tara:strand:+ start:2123 stop:3985 length:1863 start_codon:yes stop_codon:yes gene_type:complete
MKKFVVQIFNLIFISFLLNNQALAHHTSEKNFGLKVFGEKKDIYEKYCTNKKNIKPYYQKIKEDGNTTPKKRVTNEKGEDGWLLKSYHQIEHRELKSILIDGKLYAAPRVSQKYFNFNAKPTDKLKDVLDKYCLRSLDPEQPIKLNEVYRQIAKDNGLENANKKIEDDLYINGILIKIPNLVYHLPDFLIADIAKKDKETKQNIKKTEENRWVSENRPRILEKAEKFLQDQDDKIVDLFSKLNDLKKEYMSLKKSYEEITKSLKRMEKARLIQNMSDPKVKSLYLDLLDKEDQYLSDTSNLDNLDMTIKKTQKKIESLKSTSNYQAILNLIRSIKGTSGKKSLQNNEKNIEVLNSINFSPIDKNLQKTKKDIQEFSNIISEIEELKNEIISLDESIGSGINYTTVAIVIIGILLTLGIGFYVYSQNRKISSLSSATDSAGRKFSELEGQLKSTSERLQSVASSSRSDNDQSKSPAKATQKPQTPEEIIANKYDDLISDYKDAIDDFSKVVTFKQKWNGLALSRKERQDGTKTILINSSRAFEKSEIWCLNFDNKFFAFPGSTVKSNMAAYMNLDFEKAQRDFKGVFSITSGSSYSAEPSVLRRGGAGFVVERPGKLIFPQ